MGGGAPELWGEAQIPRTAILPFLTGVLFGAAFLLAEMMSSKPMSIESVTPREKLIMREVEE